MRITLCARSKILQLLEPGTSFRVEATYLPEAGQHVDLIPHSDDRPGDCIISDIPKVVASYETVNLLHLSVIDYDYDTQEFIISNRGVK